MNTISILITLAFWVTAFVRMTALFRFILSILAGVVGGLFSLAGGLNYLWDRSMQPGQASAVVFVCGLLILASQIPAFIRSLLAGRANGEIDGPD